MAWTILRADSRKLRKMPSLRWPIVLSMRAHASSKTWPMRHCEPSAIFCGHNWMRSISLTSIQAGRHRARSGPRRNLMKPELSAVPRLAPGVRLNEKSQKERILLMPERALKLLGPSLEIVVRCDGKHTVEQIAEALQKLYSKAEPQRITDDLLDYLARLHDQRAIDF